jgi:hypothetical protein
VKVPARRRGTRIALLICRERPARRRPNSCAGTERNKENPMMDILMLALGFGFFALAVGYTYACERL